MTAPVTFPQVAGVAVFGVPDYFYGEEIRTFCRDKIAHYKIPKYIWFVEEFPITVTGKLQKYKMRELAVARLQQERGGS